MIQADPDRRLEH